MNEITFKNIEHQYDVQYQREEWCRISYNFLLAHDRLGFQSLQMIRHTVWTVLPLLLCLFDTRCTKYTLIPSRYKCKFEGYIYTAKNRWKQRIFMLRLKILQAKWVEMCLIMLCGFYWDFSKELCTFIDMEQSCQKLSLLFFKGPLYFSSKEFRFLISKAIN